MRLPGKNQLHRAPLIGKQTNQPLGIVQEEIGALIGSKAARKSKRQHVLIENAARIRQSSTFCGKLTRIPFARAADQRLSPFGTHQPQLRVGELPNVILDRTVPAPTPFAAGRGPERVRLCRIPGRYVNAVGHGADRNLLLGPSRKEWLEDMPAHPPMQLAHAVDLAAAPDGELRHIEGFRSISRILPAQREQILKRDGEFILCIMAEILFGQVWDRSGRSRR